MRTQLVDNLLTDLLQFVCRLVTTCAFLRVYNLGGLKTRKNTGTSCPIEIHFSVQTTKFLLKYNLPYIVSKFTIDLKLSLRYFFTKFLHVSEKKR